MGLSKMLYEQTGSEKSNMAAIKSAVPISKLVDKIETKVQRLYVYEVQLPNGTNGECIATLYQKV